VVLLGWWGLRQPTMRLAFLAVMSYVFYAYWDWRFLGLMWLSTGIDYAAARMIVRAADRRRARLYLIAALAANLALLGYFKYAGFFLDSLQGIGSALGADTDLPALHVVLPIGISFYTFNSMSYTIDVYRGVCRPARNFVHYAAFVAMFPHLIAGPIVRYADIDSQLARLAPRLTAVLAGSGIFFFACGLAKKLLFADTLAPTVDALFARHDSLGLISAWAAALGYSLQLYFDFSGYSDMAVGLAFLLGFRFPQNFNSPFKAVNISDFWRRWHMSLSFFLRDYLFIPLGGSRGSRAQTLRNLLIVMFLGGLWHGAAWTFVVWGLLHGLFLVVHAVARGAGLTPPSVMVSRAITFIAVVAAFVVFRAATLGDALDVLGGMAGLHGVGVVSFGATYALVVAALLVFVNVAPNTWEIAVRPTPRVAAALGLVAAVAVLQISEPSPFLYFQF
jgi:alginate O-acetyltransferase complex protein AlgI